jgi:hypothetical protein
MPRIKGQNKESSTEAQAAKNTDVINSHLLFYLLTRELDFLSFWLMRFRVSLERHFPKLAVTLLFMPFAVIVFLFGWVLVNLEV